MLKDSNSSNKPSNLIWVDLEMTGLNPDLNHILEIAIVITDSNLNIISEPFNQIIYQPAENLFNMVDFVKNMHIKNGLLKLLNAGVDILTVENLALEFISKYVKSQGSPMCGNSICLDRRFLFKYMPRLEQYFHYRNLDVSTVKNLGLYWFPEKVKYFKKTDSSHRAKDDILESINELKFYRENIFIK